VKALQTIEAANVAVLLLDAAKASPSRTRTSPATSWNADAPWCWP
jgi:hypothetical protein